VIEHHGQTILRGRYDGEYDKTNLPEELILTSYFTVRDRRIVTLIIIHNATAATTKRWRGVPGRADHLSPKRG